MKRGVAFVCHDLIGNGARGEAARKNREALRSIAQSALEVPRTLLYLGKSPLSKAVRNELSELGWQLEFIGAVKRNLRKEISFSIDDELALSEILWERLSPRNFAAIIFQDRLGVGFYSIRAQKMGLSFNDTALLVAMSGPTSFLCSQECSWSENPFRDLRLSFLERYCCENADGVLTDSPVADWCRMQLWSQPRSSGEWQGLNLGQMVDGVLRERRSRSDSGKRVSVCVAHFNHGEFLPAALRALAENDYPNFEVLVVDDASTDPSSLKVFDGLAEEYETRGWRFLKQASNTGPQGARNFAVSHATGELIVFADADNLSRPYMLSEFVKGMDASGADSLSCWFDIDRVTRGQKDVAKPLGAALEFGWLTNVFGDTNFCIRRDVFARLGGFRLGPVKGVEDWDLLARLSSLGYRHDVYPKVLYIYRELADSLSRSTDDDVKYRALLEGYTIGLPPHIRRLFFEYLVPAHRILSRREHRFAQGFTQLMARLGRK